MRVSLYFSATDTYRTRTVPNGMTALAYANRWQERCYRVLGYYPPARLDGYSAAQFATVSGR